MDVTMNSAIEATAGGAATREHSGGGMWRTVGLLYLLFGLGIGWVAFFVARHGAVTHYHIPEGCAALECTHGIKTTPDGRHHCAAYPPQEMTFAGRHPGYVRFCAVASPSLAALALLFATLGAVAGLLWAVGYAWPVERRSLLLSICAAGPPAALVGLFAAVWLMFPYGAPFLK